MTASKASAAFSTKFQFKSGEGGVPPAVPIAEVTTINPPKMKADTIDVTSHDSPDGHREFVAGLRDGGDVSIEGNFIATDAGQTRLLSNMQAGTKDSYEIVFPGTIGKWAFDALVTAFEPGAAAVDGEISFSCTMKVTGKPVFTAGA